MKPRITVLTGHSAGSQYVFSKPYITVGRHPASDLGFDADRELDVSAHHAAILKQGDRWFVRDLGSRNGTLVNGHKATADVKLDDTDQIRFGAQGPLVEVRLVPDSSPDVLPPRGSGAAGIQDPGMASGSRLRPSIDRQDPAPSGSTTQRIRAEVGRQTRGLRLLTIAMFAALVSVVGALVWQSQRQAIQRDREAHAIQARVDSLLAASDAAIQSLKGQVEGLASALRASEGEVAQLREQLTKARQAGDAQQVEALRRRLSEATQALRNQQVAAQVDYPSLYETNQSSVAMIYVEFQPGEVYTGTAFAITKSGLMITTRHVVAGDAGNRQPRRLGVKFADSDQNFPARLLATSKEADVAVVKVDIRGGNPAISLSLASAPRPGDPVAIIGFPLGPDLPMSGGGPGAIARTSLTAGTVSKVLPDLVQVDGYGTEGSSGSPIFNREGQVVAILYGGQPGSGGRILFGVPVSYVARLAAPYLGSP